MMKLARVTEVKGKAIAIGHVGVSGKVCSTGICQSMAEFEKRHIKIVPVSELFDEILLENNFF